MIKADEIDTHKKTVNGITKQLVEIAIFCFSSDFLSNQKVE